MKKVDPTVLQETRYIATWVLVFSAFTQAVFLIIGKWDTTVILGNLYSALIAVGNFFLMGLSVQKALGKEEKDAKAVIKVSMLYRTLLLIILTGVGIFLPFLSIWTVIIPLFFPRVAIAIRPFVKKA